MVTGGERWLGQGGLGWWVGSYKWCACLASPRGLPHPIVTRTHLCGEQRLLGSGGHAKVYEATLGSQQVALKVVGATDPAARHEVRAVRCSLLAA